MGITNLKMIDIHWTSCILMNTIHPSIPPPPAVRARFWYSASTTCRSTWIGWRSEGSPQRDCSPFLPPGSVPSVERKARRTHTRLIHTLTQLARVKRCDTQRESGGLNGGLWISCVCWGLNLSMNLPPRHRSTPTENKPSEAFKGKRNGDRF